MTAAYVVDPGDEARHTPEPEDLWSESYYADFVQADGTLGGWLRLGMYPNRQVAWWTAYIVGPDRAGVHSVNYALPVPADRGLVSEDAATRVELHVLDPLKEFRIAAAAPASIYHYAEDAYTDVPGVPVELEVDLTWTTDGTPYHYSVTPRYEIPCLVAGTVTLDGEVLTAAGQGQRDHSWAARDWWAFGWCWSSARLDDGTRIHLSDIRVPNFPMFFGYVLSGGDVHPITALSVIEEAGPNGMPTSARLEIESGATGPEAGAGAAAGTLGIDVTPLAYGPVLLVDEESGRTSHFPRAMVRYSADDGRQGMGWIEWNQPDPQ